MGRKPSNAVKKKNFIFIKSRRNSLALPSLFYYIFNNLTYLPKKNNHLHRVCNPTMPRGLASPLKPPHLGVLELCTWLNSVGAGGS